MKILMIVGSAKDIFIYNMCKWLKSMMNVYIDIIEYNSSSKHTTSYDYKYYDNVRTMPSGYLFDSIPFIRRYTLDWDKGRQLKKMLVGSHYDIIQCHYVLGLYASATYLKKHCDKLYFTFWGGERKKSKYLGSNYLFRRGLSKILINYSDGIINGGYSLAETWERAGKRPLVYLGNFGSTPLENLYNLIKIETKAESKKKLNIPIDKLTVQLGYSGKRIHRYIEIINEFAKHDSIKNKVHLIAPMTRGADMEYVDDVEKSLEASGFSYTLLRDCYLTDLDVARLRNSVDIALQMSSYDGYSRSIVECLCARALLIYGDWLKYENAFRRDGFRAVKVPSIESAIDYIENVVCVWGENEEIQKMIQFNIEKGRGKYLWSECIKDWVAVYKGTAKPMSHS